MGHHEDHETDQQNQPTVGDDEDFNDVGVRAGQFDHLRHIAEEAVSLIRNRVEELDGEGGQ